MHVHIHARAALVHIGERHPVQGHELALQRLAVQPGEERPLPHAVLREHLADDGHIVAGILHAEDEHRMHRRKRDGGSRPEEHPRSPRRTQQRKQKSFIIYYFVIIA